MAEDYSREAKALFDYLEWKYPGEHAVCREAVLVACGTPVARLLRVLFSELFGFVMQATLPRKPSATDIVRATLDDLRSSRETLVALKKQLSRSKAQRERHLRTLLVSSTQELEALIKRLSAVQGDV